MTPEIQLLARLKQTGYFDRGEFDPQPVFQVCRVHFGLDVSTQAGSEQIDVMIRRLTADGLAQFEYSSEPTLHPKDKLDYWRLVLTPTGVATLEHDNPAA